MDLARSRSRARIDSRSLRRAQRGSRLRRRRAPPARTAPAKAIAETPRRTDCVAVGPSESDPRGPELVRGAAGASPPPATRPGSDAPPAEGAIVTFTGSELCQRYPRASG